jgi:hypothetical protein
MLMNITFISLIKMNRKEWELNRIQKPPVMN